MEEKMEVIENYLCIQMPKEVDHFKAMKIREKADRMLLSDQVENIVFDFEKTVFMDSSGIGVILGRMKKIRGLGGRVYIIHAKERVERILRLSGILRYVELMKEE